MLRGMDGFDHYGDDASLMLDGQYAEVNASISSANPRSGTRHLRITPENQAGYRWVYGDDLEEAGHEYAFWVPNLPTDSLTWVLAEFRNNDNEQQFGIRVTTTGQVQLYQSNGGDVGTGITLATSKANVVKTKAYQHFGVRGRCDSVTGSCEVRLNGVTVLNVSGKDTKGTGSHDSVIAQVVVGAPRNSVSALPNPLDIDDATWWDTETGSDSSGLINDFVGDKKIYTEVPDADTSTEEWTPSEGTDSFAILANIPPSDDDEYLTAETSGLATRVSLSDLPGSVVAISAVMTVVRAWKTDAGDSKIKVGMVSGGEEDDGAMHALSEAPTYFSDVHETDPATGTLWTVDGFNAAELVLERTE